MLHIVSILTATALTLSACATAPTGTTAPAAQTDAQAAEAILGAVADFCPTGVACNSNVEYAATGQVINRNGHVTVDQRYEVTVNGGVQDRPQHHHYTWCGYDGYGVRYCY